MFVASRFYAYWFKRLSSPTLLHGPTSLVTKPRSPGFKNKSKVRNHVLQRDSKRWTHFVTVYGLISNRRLNTRQTVGCGIPSSLLALRVDLRGLRSKLSWIRLTFSSDTRGRPELLPLHIQPICSNWWFQWQMLFLVGGWMLKWRWNARCTAVADPVLMNSRTQKILCCIVVILLSTDAAARLCAGRAL